MTPLLARAVAQVHGHLGWLSALALAHPALMLRRPRRRVVGVALAATVLVTTAAGLGAALYPSYRTTLKPGLFATAPLVGALFERKEHLGVLSLVLAWAGLAFCALAARRSDARSTPARSTPDHRSDVARAAFVAYAGAATAALTSAAAGLIVAVHRPF